MDALFLTLLKMSLSAGWVVLAVLAARLLLKKAPKWLHCALWALVAFRLVCPVSIESPASLMPEQEVIQSENGEIAIFYSAPAANVENTTEAYANFKAPSSDAKARTAAPAEVSEETSVNWTGILSLIWLLGMIILLGYAAVSYLRLRRRVNASIELGNGVHLCDYIDTPFILGIFRPRIYLPSEMDPRDAAHVLSHERAHLKRRDHWWKPLGFALLSVYWFHPLLWVAYILLCRDIELACDEAVVKDMALTDKKEYSEALLKCSVPRHMVVACPLAFGEVGVKERVKSVLRYKKPAFWVVLIAVILCIAVGVCFLTDPVSEDTASLNGMFDTSAVKDMEELKGFDWNTLEEVLSPGTYTLFDPLFHGDYLYIGCQGQEQYYVLSFQKTETGYVFEEVLTPKLDAPNQSPPRGELLTVFLEDQERDLALYIITEETISGIETYTGIWNYHHIDHWPALLVFDKADWGITDDYYFRVRNDIPMTMGVDFAENGTQPQFFEAGYQDPERNFIYSTQVFFYDGYHMTGYYSLEEADIQKLLDILFQIPASAYSPCPQPESTIYTTELYLWLDDGVLMDKMDTLLTLCYREDSVILGISNRYGDGASMYSSSEPMYYFTVDDPALREYLLSLCDDSRRSGTTISYNEPQYIEYRHESAVIRVASLRGWQYEIVEYTDETTPFGIRARPNQVDEGWLFYSCWPSGFSPGEEFGEMPGVTYGNGRTRVWYPLSELKKDIRNAIWTYQLSVEHSESYVVVNEGADAWLLKYEHYQDHDFGIDALYTQDSDPSKGGCGYIFGTSKQNEGYILFPEDWLFGYPYGETFSYPQILRFWPEGQLEGFISITHQEGSFTPEEGLLVEKLQFSFPAYTATAEGAEHWQYLWIPLENECYVLRNDGADHWTDKQWQEAMEMIAAMEFDLYKTS